MRRVDDLAGAVLRLDRILACAAEVAAPPCADIRGVVASVGDAPVVALLRAAERLLNAFDQDQRVRVDIEDCVCALRCSICPVVLVGRAVPLCSVLALLTFAVRLILEVEREQGIVILVLIRKPDECVNPDLRCDACLAVPQVVVVTGVIGMRAVDINERFDAVLFALLHDDVEDLHAVLERFAVGLNEIRIDRESRICVARDTADRIRLAVHPRDEQLGRNREADDVDAAVSNLLQDIVDIRAPEVVCAVLGAVEAEPVCTGQPDFITVLVIDAAALAVEPVIVGVICRSDGHRSLEAAACKADGAGCGDECCQTE